MDDFDFDMAIGQIEAENDLIWTREFSSSCYQKMKKTEIKEDDFKIPF